VLLAQKELFQLGNLAVSPTKFVALSLQMVRGLPLEHFQMSSLRGKADKDGDIAPVGCLISGLCLMIEWPTIVHSCGMKSWIGLHSICWKATHDVLPSNRLHSETSDAFVVNAGDKLAAPNRPLPLP